MRLRLLRRNLLLLALASLALALLIYVKLLAVAGAGAESRETAQATPPRPRYGDAGALRASVYGMNHGQRVLNADRFPDEPEVVLVVQVHNRPAYLKMLVRSLENTAEVRRFLVIFSHDHLSEEIAGIVQGVTFCKVLQIYYPFSQQLYPGEFPGQDPKDCPRDVGKEAAVKAGCLNAEHPDSYGHYREAHITQAKHHWWWKLHFAWERVRALQGFSGFAVFIEEDNYLLPDFYHFLKNMSRHRKAHCPDCDMLALGNHDGTSGFNELSGKLETTGWLSTKHNLGMGISREIYYKMMGCSDEFCTYDDYNWDWTLQSLSGTCISKPLKVLAARGTRVLHTGDCGLHQKDACQPEQAHARILDSLRQAKAALFPDTLAITRQGPVEHRAHVKNGGWGDIRDHALCKTYAKRL